MRTIALTLLAAMLVAGSALAETTFVSPLAGSQAIGPQVIEIATDVANVNRVEFYVDGTLAGVARKAPWRIAHDFGTSLASRRVTAKVFANNFRHVTTTEVRTAAMTAGELLDVDLVEVPLRVRAGGTITEKDLVLRENGKAQTIRDVRSTRGPAHFAFVIDRSLSMGDGRLEAALRAVDAARKLLHDDDTVSVTLFNHHVSKARTVRRAEKVTALFGDVVPSGGTSLRDAMASIPRRDRTYVIVITDGGDRNSEIGEAEALRKISGTKTVVDAVVLGTRSRFLDQAAKNTGGEVVTAKASTVAKAIAGLIADINRRYLLVYQSAGNDKGWRTIDIRGARAGVAVANARKGYFAE